MVITTPERICAIQAAKAIIRKKTIHILKDMTLKDCMHQSEIVQEKLMKTLEWKRAKRISLYLSMEKEIQTETLVETALQEGKECFIPICKKDDMQMLKLHDLEDLKKLPRNSWGIREPKPIKGREDAMKTGGVDLVVVPGVAFTAEGHRVGHGKGYYDRFLKALKELPMSDDQIFPRAIGLAFRQQIFAQLPVNDFDVQIDHVIFPSDEKAIISE